MSTPSGKRIVYEHRPGDHPLNKTGWGLLGFWVEGSNEYICGSDTGWDSGFSEPTKEWADHIVSCVNATVTKPSDRDRREAAAAIIEWRETRPRDEAAADALLEEIFARALAARSAVPDGHVRLPDGREVKVLGDIILTADGMLPGNNAVLWLKPRGDFPQDGARRRVNSCEHFQLLYSTKEAAESAARGGER